MTHRFFPHVTVAAVVERDGRFLFVEEIAGGEQVINQPAGHLDPDESLLDAVVRETLEETGWDVEPLHLVGIYLWKHPDNGKTFLRATVAARAVAERENWQLDDGILQALWLSRDELDQRGEQLRSPMVTRCVDDFLAGREYPLDALQHLG